MMFMDRNDEIYSSDDLNELTIMELENLNFHVCNRFKPFWGDMHVYR
jgi:hypothetical protein